MNRLDKQKEEIDILRQKMYSCAEKHQNNFLHPDVYKRQELAPSF